MLERQISELRDKHSKHPISQDEFDGWRRSKVTQRLFEELEVGVMEGVADQTTDHTLEGDKIAIQTALNEGANHMIDILLAWSPSGVKGVNDE